MQKILKVHMRITTLTSENSKPLGTSLSGVIFNLVNSITNDWTPLFEFKIFKCRWNIFSY